MDQSCSIDSMTVIYRQKVELHKTGCDMTVSAMIYDNMCKGFDTTDGSWNM